MAVFISRTADLASRKMWRGSMTLKAVCRRSDLPHMPPTVSITFSRSFMDRVCPRSSMDWRESPPSCSLVTNQYPWAWDAS